MSHPCLFVGFAAGGSGPDGGLLPACERPEGTAPGTSQPLQVLQLDTSSSLHPESNAAGGRHLQRLELLGVVRLGGALRCFMFV